MTQKLQDHDRINNLEIDLVGVKHELQTNNETLKEIKDVLVRQSTILENVTAIRQTVNQVQEDVADLEDTFEKRKETTDANNKVFLEFVNRAKGALAICMIVFGIVQTAIYDSFSENQVAHKEFQQEIKVLQKQVTVLETKVDKNSSKTHQNASE